MPFAAGGGLDVTARVIGEAAHGPAGPAGGDRRLAEDIDVQPVFMNSAETQMMFNYHDFGHMGVDRARVNEAVFKALKPGGVYVIADHAGRSGTGISEAGTLHRIEEAFLRREVEAAGLRWAASGDFLRNPADPRARNTPAAHAKGRVRPQIRQALTWPAGLPRR